MERRDQVLIGFLLLLPAASTFLMQVVVNERAFL